MADIGPWRVPKSGYVTITKIENVHIDVHVEKFTDSKNAILFDLWRKLTKLLRKNRVRTVASPGACERLAVYRSSSMHPSSLALLNACCSYFFPVFVWWAVWDAMACWVTLSRWPTAIRLLVIRSTTSDVASRPTETSSRCSHVAADSPSSAPPCPGVLCVAKKLSHIYFYDIFGFCWRNFNGF